MILDQDGLKEVWNLLKSPTTLKGYFSLVWQLGAVLVVVVYFRTILKGIKFIGISIWKAIAGTHLDSKELMGGTCWLFFFLSGFKYIITDKVDLGFLGLLLLYYCVMFGIDKGIDKIKTVNTEQKIKQDFEQGVVEETNKEQDEYI